MKRRTALWKSCIFMLLLCAGWQAQVGSKGVLPKTDAARPYVQGRAYSRQARHAGHLSQKANASAANTRKLAVSFARLPLNFEPNQGQADERVKFLSHGRGYGLFLTGDEAVLEVQDSGFRSQESGASSQKSAEEARKSTLLGALRRSTDNGPRTTDVLRLKFVNANENATVMGAQELPGKVNYFLGKDPAKWRTNLPTYAQVRYRNIYPGIDSVYYGNQGGQLEYDFVVAPGADPGAITFEVGAVRDPPLRIDRDGDLVIPTEGGVARFHKPAIYQPGSADEERTTDNGRRTAANPKSKIQNPKSVQGRFILEARNRVRFALGPYDHSRPLVIDPSLIYSTYLGGAGDQAKGVVVDSAGNAYVTGTTLSAAFPLANPYQSVNKAKNGTVFVSKLNPAGSAFVYSTYLGGSTSEQGNAIAIDSSGDAYVTGSTCSSDFPTASPVQAGLKGSCDGFVTELNPAGSALVYSTYLGGSGDAALGMTDEGTGIAVDASGDAYVTGGTWSSDFPTVNPIQSYGGGEDAFLCKVNAGGGTLAYSTYLGGSAQDQGNGIAVDSSGNAYVIGFTLSTNFPMVNPFQATNNATTYGTAFVAKLNSSGSALVYSTYLGGSVMETGEAIAVDSSGNAYLAGATWSANFPTFIPVQSANAAKYGGSNAFVTKLNAAGSALLYSTYLGGSGHSANPSPSSGGDTAYGIAVDPLGVTFVAGLTGSLDFPTVNALQASNNSTQDFTSFIACLTSAGTALGYSTYLGGTGEDVAYAISVNSSDNTFVVGATTSPDFPTASPVQATPGGVFVAQISPPPAVALFPTSLNFGTVAGNTTSQEQIVTLSSINASAVDILSITSSGDFALETTATSCPSGGGTMPAGANCTLNVAFTPTATGTQTGDVTINYSGLGSPLAVPLTGVGIVSAVNVTPASLSFSSQVIGTESASQPVTLLNIGSVELTVSSVAVSSGFRENNNCTPTVAALSSCSINVSFQPTASGLQNGTLTITDLAGNSPQTVSLSGTGVSPAVSLSATALSFTGQTVSTTSPPQTLTLTDTGNGALTPLLFNTSGDFAQTNTCPSSLVPGASCTISVTFTPSATGNRSGTLSITDNATNSPQTVSLTGMGQDFALATSPGAPSSATIIPGQTAKYALIVNPLGGFNQPVALTCGGIPVEASCSLSPATVNPGTSFTLLVTTTSPSFTLPRSLRPPRFPGTQTLLALLLASLAWALFALGRRGAHGRKRVLALAAGLLLALALAACRGGPAPGSNHGTPTGTYTLQVTGTFTYGTATVARSVTLTLNVS